MKKAKKLKMAAKLAETQGSATVYHKGKVYRIKTDALKVTQKQKALIAELSETLHVKPGVVLTRALELLKEAEYNRRMFFDPPEEQARCMPP